MMEKSMIKALFFDIDGTLLSFHTKQIPETAYEGLQILKQKGYRLFIASGRPPVQLPLLPKQLTEFPWDGMVLFNGQYCMDAEKNVVRKQPIPRKTFKTLVPYLKEHCDFPCTFMELESSFDIRFNPHMYEYLKSIGQEDKMTPVKDVERAYDVDIYQVCPYIPPEGDEEFVRHAPGAKSARWTDDFADIIPEDGGKPVGMQTMMNLYGLTREECMSFGDGANDISMLEYAGIGVAMGNASDTVKNAADYVTDDIDNNGLRKAFEYFNLF